MPLKSYTSVTLLVIPSMVLFYFILIYARFDSSEAKVFQDTDYPLRLEGGASWRQFWWYDSAGRWPSDENDTLGTPFGHCDPAALHCFGRLPQHLIEDQSELLAVDSACNIYRWAFDSSSITGHAVWLAFHDHIQTESAVVMNSDEWKPTIIAGGPHQNKLDSWMYRWEHGVGSFILDDDNCDCYSSLNAGHAMCFDGFQSTYGTEDRFGVGLLNESGCSTLGPSPLNSLFLYYKESCEALPVTENATIDFACDSENDLQAKIRWLIGGTSSLNCKNGIWTTSTQPNSNETCVALSVLEDITPYYFCNSNNNLQATLRSASYWTSQLCVNGEWIVTEQSTSNALKTGCPVDTTQPTVQTTQPPVQTTQPQVQTTQPPVQTTQPPVQTTQPPVQTTQPPVQTTQPSMQTSQPPVQTTQPPAQTTQPLIQTTQPPVQTTQPPVQTTQPSMQTTQPPVQTTQPPVQTTQPPVQTTQPPVQTTQPPVQTTQPPVQTTQPPVQTTLPPVQTTQSPVQTTLPPVQTTQSLVQTTQPTVPTTQPTVTLPTTHSTQPTVTPPLANNPTTIVAQGQSQQESSLSMAKPAVIIMVISIMLYFL